MTTMGKIKKLIIDVLCASHIGTLFRRINKKKILIICYHGITKRDYELSCPTHINVNDFERQIKFIKKRYNIMKLSNVVNLIQTGSRIPSNIAVITFDDGYENNYRIAFPILKEYLIPATIFITAGLIDTEKLLPLDKIYLAIAHSQNKMAKEIEQIGMKGAMLNTVEEKYRYYIEIVNKLKNYPIKEQNEYIRIIIKNLYKNGLNNNWSDVEDFKMLTWKNIEELIKSNLIEIGSHTLNHEILNNINISEAEKEILKSRSIIKHFTKIRVSSFAYPNGRKQDYNEQNIECLNEAGFICAVTTMPKLNDKNTNIFELGRMCIGPDLSGRLQHFELFISGFISIIKTKLHINSTLSHHQN